MKNKTNKVSSRVKYSDEQIEARVVSDFLPSPDTLVLKEKKQRPHK